MYSLNFARSKIEKIINRGKNGIIRRRPAKGGTMAYARRPTRVSHLLIEGGNMWFFYILIGVMAGIAGGLFGIGGGTILIPALVFLFGLTQHQAQGTSLAIMVPPIGLLAAWKYYSQGNVKLGMALFICIGFLFGGLIGAHYVHKISDPLLKKLFGAYLLFISLKMILGK